MSNLVDHARRELVRAGLFEKTSDYDGMLGHAVMELMSVFARQEHSGGSATMVSDLFNRLSRFKTLTPLTNDSAEWMEVGENMHQNARDSSCFSTDGGRTYYDIDTEDRVTQVSKVTP